MADDFRECQKIMTSSGDENRQHILLMMAENGSCGGLRVNEITKMSHLSHPAAAQSASPWLDSSCQSVQERSCDFLHGRSRRRNGFMPVNMRKIKDLRRRGNRPGTNVQKI